jgi:hypothetical protein
LLSRRQQALRRDDWPFVNNERYYPDFILDELLFAVPWEKQKGRPTERPMKLRVKLFELALEKGF